MKRMLLGTSFGRIGISIRDLFEVIRAMYARPEMAGMLANDRIARMVVTRLCRDGQTFVDVGAHIGSILAEVTYHCRSARIVAVEAAPDKIAHLKRTFPNVELHSCAVGESRGECTFYVNTKRPGYSSLCSPAADESANVQQVNVPLERLDDIISYDNVDVIKIDVEGAELGVLRGAEQLIARSRPTVMFESGPRAAQELGYTKEGLWQWFAERDYSILIPNRVAHHDDGLSQVGFLESHRYPRRTTNYFAVAHERREEIRQRARQVLRLPLDDATHRVATSDPVAESVEC